MNMTENHAQQTLIKSLCNIILFAKLFNVRSRIF